MAGISRGFTQGPAADHGHLPRLERHLGAPAVLASQARLTVAPRRPADPCPGRLRGVGAGAPACAVDGYHSRWTVPHPLRLRLASRPRHPPPLRQVRPHRLVAVRTARSSHVQRLPVRQGSPDQVAPRLCRALVAVSPAVRLRGRDRVQPAQRHLVLTKASPVGRPTPVGRLAWGRHLPARAQRQCDGGMHRDQQGLAEVDPPPAPSGTASADRDGPEVVRRQRALDPPPCSAETPVFRQFCRRVAEQTASRHDAGAVRSRA
jgi:hypothetical protein